MWRLTERFRPLLTLILGLTFALLCTRADAHALDFASLTVEQIQSDAWRIHLQQTNNVPSATTAAGNGDPAVQLLLPSHCETGYASQGIKQNNQESWQWQVRCVDQPLQWIEILRRNQPQVFFHWKTLDGSIQEQLLDAGAQRFERRQKLLDEESSGKSRDMAGYLTMGITHIAIGFDHLAFVLLAVLIAARMKAIFLVITAFTLGHCLTLILASLNLIVINPVYVEWLIALSIVFPAVEIIRNQSTITLQQPAIVAGLFGLVHGLGFASVLTDGGLPEENRIVSLLLFNLGVEIGQLAFVALIAPLLYQLRKISQRWPKQCLVYGVGGLAGYWLVARTLML